MNLAYLACNTYICIGSEEKSTIHEIRQISWQGLIYTAYLACNRLIHVYLYWFCRKVQQNPLFMKSGGFHGEIWQISS